MLIDIADLRWFTALCQIFIGLVLIRGSLKVWFMPLHVRAVKFEPFFTAAGLRMMLKGWPMVFVAGAMLIVSGASRGIYWMRYHGYAADAVAHSVGLLEALFSLWAVGSIIAVAIQTKRAR